MASAFFKKWVRVARIRLSGTSDNFADLILTARAHAQRCWERFAGGAPAPHVPGGLWLGRARTRPPSSIKYCLPLRGDGRAGRRLAAL